MNFLFPFYRKWLLIIIPCTVGIASSANSQSIQDSLLHIINTESNPEIRIEAYHELAWINRRKDPDIASKYAQSGIEEAQKIDDKNRMSVGYVRLAEVERLRRNYIEAITFFQQSRQLEEEITNAYGIARAYYGIALCLRSLNRLNEANSSINQSVETLIYTEHKELLARSYHQLALIKDELTEYEEALDALTKKMEIAEELNDIRLQATTSAFMGVIHRKHGSYDLAESAYQQLTLLWDSIGNPDQTSRAFTDLAAVYIEQKKYDMATEATLKSKAICEQFDYQLTLASNFNNLGIIAKANNELKKAIGHFLKCVSIKEALNDKSELFVNHYNLGNSYKQLSLLDSAVYHYERSIILNQLNMALKMEAFWNLSEIFLLKNLQDSAIKYQQGYGVLRDSTDQLLAESNRFKDNFQYAIKEREILFRDNQIQRVSIAKQKQMIFGLFTILFLIIGMGILYFRSFQLKQRSLLIEKETEIQKQKIEDLLKDHEIQLLDGREKERKRIAQDLHDRLGSMLSVVKIHFKSLEENSEIPEIQCNENYGKASDLLDSACDEVRKISHNMMSGVLVKFGLISALKSLSKSVNSTGQLRLNILSFGFDNDSETARLNGEIETHVYRMVQELLSNVLKHADAKEMDVQLLKKAKNLNVVVEDDGIGFNPETATKEGLGLKNLKTRVNKLAGQMNLDTGKGSGTTITIDIPL